MNIHTIPGSIFVTCCGVSYELNPADDYKGWKLIYNLNGEHRQIKGLSTKEALEAKNELGGRIKPAIKDALHNRRMALAMLVN